MSLLTKIGDFSYERMDELAVQIVHLKHVVECMEDRMKDDRTMIRNLEYQIDKLRGEEPRINQNNKSNKKDLLY